MGTMKSNNGNRQETSKTLERSCKQNSQYLRLATAQTVLSYPLPLKLNKKTSTNLVQSVKWKVLCKERGTD